MKFLYYLRVLIISPEALILLLFWLMYLSLFDQFSSNFEGVVVNPDALKWIVLYPVSIAVWMLKEGAFILFPDESLQKILHGWGEYWRLRVHFNVGIFYAISLVIPCVYLWFTKNISTDWGILLFLACAVAISCSGLSFYNARIKVKELLLRAK